jgi:uncharacterized small protein (DUF1192 family)
MLMTFKSKAAADVLMYEMHAKPLIDLLHKDVQRGVITVAELPAAVALLEAEVAQIKAIETARERAQASALNDNQDEEALTGALLPVSFATRTYPLMEMLRAALKARHDVLWGV